MSFKFITSDDEGRIYAVTDQGDLLYYRDEARNGTAQWAYGGVGQKIGNGWGGLLKVILYHSQLLLLRLSCSKFPRRAITE